MKYIPTPHNSVSHFQDESVQNQEYDYQERNGLKLKDKTVYLDPDQADKAYLEGTPDALLGVTIAPVQISFDTVCYKMLISADTHELFYFEKSKYKGPSDGRFTDAEAKRFERRGATVVR